MKMNIDLVYLWVDGNDPEWRKKRNAFIGKIEENSEATCKGRYINNDELKYSLRSAEKYAPWIRKIFIVTDNQTPDWLDISNPKVKIINQGDIIPQESLPCFNSNIIEYFLYKIPDLSEHFLYANDDMFFGDHVQPDFFFSKDGFPIIRLKKKSFGKLRYWWKYLRRKAGPYRTAIHEAATLVERYFGTYYSGSSHHNVDSYRKTDYRDAIENVFYKQAEKSFRNHLRAKGDLHRSLISYYALAIGHGHFKNVERRESLTIHVQKPDFMKVLLRHQPRLFCLNDNHLTTDEDRTRIKPFLEELFPEKSAFEK
jgi:hypothetical protein